jgi:hypothetical protein
MVRVRCAEELLKGTVKPGDTAYVTLGEDGLVFKSGQDSEATTAATTAS